MINYFILMISSYYTSLISFIVETLDAKVKYINSIVSFPFHILTSDSLILVFKKSIVTLIPIGVDVSDLIIAL